MDWIFGMTVPVIDGAPGDPARSGGILYGGGDSDEVCGDVFREFMRAGHAAKSARGGMPLHDARRGKESVKLAAGLELPRKSCS
jgi:hypothetical protein